MGERNGRGEDAGFFPPDPLFETGQGERPLANPPGSENCNPLPQKELAAESLPLKGKAWVLSVLSIHQAYTCLIQQRFALIGHPIADDGLQELVQHAAHVRAGGHAEGAAVVAVDRQILQGKGGLPRVATPGVGLIYLPEARHECIS